MSGFSSGDPRFPVPEPLIQKPFTSLALLGEVRRMLDRSSRLRNGRSSPLRFPRRHAGEKRSALRVDHPQAA